MEKENNLFEKVSNWLRNSVMLKLLTITILMLLLLIPSAMIQDVIRERQSLQHEAIEEVSSKWANGQELNGPILTVPLLYEHEKDGKLVESISYHYLLPKELTVNGNLKPQKLRRGIYEVVVYDSDLKISGTFDLDLSFDENHLKAIQFDKAFFTIGISDLRGIGNNINFKWGNKNLKVESGSKITDLISSGITVYPKDIRSQKGKGMAFNFSIDLQGSQNLTFIPVGCTILEEKPLKLIFERLFCFLSLQLRFRDMVLKSYHLKMLLRGPMSALELPLLIKSLKFLIAHLKVKHFSMNLD
jgi:inner membrane protein